MNEKENKRKKEICDWPATVGSELASRQTERQRPDGGGGRGVERDGISGMDRIGQDRIGQDVANGVWQRV